MVNANKLHARIIELGLTKKEVSEQMNISYTSIVNKFNGKTPWSLEDIVSLASILQLTKEDIVPYFFSEEVAQMQQKEA